MKYKIVIGGLLCGLVIFSISAVVGGFIERSGCPPTSYTPTVAFDITWHPENNTVDVYHVGGDSLSPNDDEGTVALFITIRDDKSGNSNRITWFDSGGILREKVGVPPVTEGDAFSVHESDVPFTLSGGDLVRVLWRGNIGHPQPFWCFNQGVGNHLLGEKTLQDPATERSE